MEKSESETKTKKRAAPSPMERYIQDFLDYCEIERNKSELTIVSYRHYLKKFAEYAASIGVTTPEQITLDTSRSFRLWLNRYRNEETGRGFKPITQNYYVIALRAFLKYLSKRDIETLSAEKIELAKNPAREISFLSSDELQRIFQAIETEENQTIRLRDHAILMMLFSSGVRISELMSLTKSALNLKTGEFTVRGKGDKLRLAFLSPETIKALEAYEKVRTDNNPALFVSESKIGNDVTRQMEAMEKQNGKRKITGLTPRSVQRIVHKYAMIAGITHPVSPHTFRHAYATDLLQNGADIRSVQTLLGHASITTTQIYTHVTNEGLRDVYKKFHNKK